MKILVVTQYYWPEQFRVNDVCEELARRGHTVTVLTGLPNYPEGEVYPGYEDASRMTEVVNGVEIVRCRMRPRHKGTLNLMRNYLSFALSAARMAKALQRDYDVVYAYGLSPVTSALPAIKYKRLTNTKIIYYCCDLWPESVLGEQNGHGAIDRNNAIYLVAKGLSKYIYNKMDLIACKCDEFVKYLGDVCNVDEAKMKTIYEHAEDLYLAVNKVPINNGTIDFMFLGNIGAAQNCGEILLAARSLKETNPFRIHFVGDGSELASLQQQVRELGLERVVTFHGRCPVSDVQRYYELADVCLLTLTNRTATGLTPPAKLTGYMAAARPVIASINGAGKRIVEDSGCGIAVPADDVEGLRAAMQQVVDSPDMFSSCGERGRNYFLEHFTLARHVDSIEQELQRLVNQ